MKQKIKQTEWNKLIAAAVECIETEAKSYPCFGLVSQKDSGCHQDMNIATFLKSSETFSIYFSAITKLALNNSQLDFVALRQLGREQEKRMFTATNNINTHKGLIFAFGILFYVTVYGQAYQVPFRQWSKLTQKLTAPLTNDFQQFTGATIGEQLFHQHHLTGARGLALSGYEVVFKEGLPFLHHYQNLYPNLTKDETNLLLLVFYLSKINDTTLIAKIGYEKSIRVAQQAEIWLQLLASAGWEHFYQTVLQHNDRYQREKISPGGCADLCVVTLFLNQFSS